MTKRLILYFVIALATCVSSAGAAPPRAKSNRQEIVLPGVHLRTYETPYYYIHTDLSEDDAREAEIRMTRMFEVYRARTAELFGGRINQKLSFYLFSNGDDYFTAGGLPGTAGVFDGSKLMAMALRDHEGKVGVGTWHVVQHEGFHQFVANVIRGQIPIWVNEGLAEYFGEAIFTGDGMITGIVSDGRLKRVQREMKEGKFKSIKEMMLMNHETWNLAMDVTNYDQAWSMVHFLAAGEDGKYRDAFAQFLQLISRAKPWDQAWLLAFGSAEGFEQKWKDYWLKMPADPTLDLIAQADVATLTSFIGRAFSQKRRFDDFKQFIGTQAKDLNAAPADWLPPQLYEQMKEITVKLQARGIVFVLEQPGKGTLPRLVCTMKDGTKITGSFEVRGNGQIGRVMTNVVKAGAVPGR